MNFLFITILFILIPTISFAESCDIENVDPCQAAEQGDAYAQYLVANYYLDGYQIKQDYGKAVFWSKKSAEQGNHNGQLTLANLYFQGHGVKQDYQQAIFWYKIAAEQGNVGAQMSLAKIYESGLGVKKDRKIAKKLRSLPCTLDCSDFIHSLQSDKAGARN